MKFQIYLFIVIWYIEVGNVGELGVDGGTEREGFEPTKAYIAVQVLRLFPNQMSRKWIISSIGPMDQHRLGWE